MLRAGERTRFLFILFFINHLSLCNPFPDYQGCVSQLSWMDHVVNLGLQ
jgi:hypothetical protein